MIGEIILRNNKFSLVISDTYCLSYDHYICNLNDYNFNIINDEQIKGFLVDDIIKNFVELIDKWYDDYDDCYRFDESVDDVLSFTNQWNSKLQEKFIKYIEEHEDREQLLETYF